MYTLIENAKLNGLVSYDYLRDAFLRSLYILLLLLKTACLKFHKFYLFLLPHFQ